MMAVCSPSQAFVARVRAPWEHRVRHAKPPVLHHTDEKTHRSCVTVMRGTARPNAGWKLSERDYPEGEVVLGIELRTHSLKAAPVDTANAEFQRPGVSAALETLSVESVEQAISKVIKHFDWKGPVGISVTYATMRVLGNQATGKTLEGMLPNSRGKVATMIHSEAAAYAEMYFGPGRESTGVVVVCTIGKGLGTGVYNLGQKVRNSDLTHLTWTYERELSKLQAEWGWESVAPALPQNADDVIERIVRLSSQIEQSRDSASERSGDGAQTERDVAAALTEGDESTSKLENDSSGGKKDEETIQAILAWAKLIDRYLQKIASSVKPERMILLPTGAAAYLPAKLLLPLFRPGVSAAGLDPDILVMAESPERALVKGAAVGAHIELGRRAASEVLRGAICVTMFGSSAPRELCEVDLYWVFRKLDRDKDKLVCHEDLRAGSRLLGTTLSDVEVTGVLRDFTGGLKEAATVEDFKAWWTRLLTSAVVREVNSIVEFETKMDDASRKPSETGVMQGDGSLVVLKCGYTHCRPCMKFERVYEGIASQYTDTMFLKVSSKKRLLVF
mmetsp:Transcript_24963/g.61513  ORF Transcript_24963/g.61513 Transcript_24963/m.61513 type:complete len:561 (-) Transcript_24963:17-1699(-)